MHLVFSDALPSEPSVPSIESLGIRSSPKGAVLSAIAIHWKAISFRYCYLPVSNMAGRLKWCMAGLSNLPFELCSTAICVIKHMVEKVGFRLLNAK